MLLERLIDMIMRKRLEKIEHKNGIFVLWLCRKHGNKNICTRNRLIIGMPIGLIKIEDNKFYMYNDHKKMTLLPEVNDNNEIVEPKIINWNKWYDMFLSEKAVDRVVNNKYRYFVRILDRGDDIRSYKRLNKILRNNWNNFYFEFEDIDETVKNVIINNSIATWDELKVRG